MNDDRCRQLSDERGARNEDGNKWTCNEEGFISENVMLSNPPYPISCLPDKTFLP